MRIICTSTIPDDLIHLGDLTKTHGLKGGVFLNLFNSEDSVLSEKPPVWLHSGAPADNAEGGGNWFQADVEKYSAAGKRPILKMSQVDSINDIESLLPLEIYVSRSDFPDKEEYLVDLVGFDVQTTDGQNLGRLKGYVSTPAHEVLVIESEGGEQLEIPFVDHFVKNTDLKSRKIEVICPEWI